MAMKHRSYPVHFVGDVAQHDGCTDVTAVKNALTADTVVLISRVALVRAIEGASGRTITNETALVINTRLGAVGRVDGSLARPRSRLSDHPTEGFLQRCQYRSIEVR